MNQKILIKSFNNFETKIENDWERVDSNILPADPKWLKYCPPIYRQRVRERIEEKKLFEERKKIFNAIKTKLSGGGLDRSTKHLIRKVDPNQPNSLSSEVQKLIVKRFQNTQEWIKEREKKEDLEANEPKEKKLKELTNQQLLIMLGGRLQSGEIKRELGSFGNCLMIETEEGMLKVDLQDGKITPNPAEEFLKKHGIDSKEKK